MSAELKLNEYAREIMRWRDGQGFYTPEGIHTEELRDYMLGKLMLVVTEVGEAAEAVRHEDIDNFLEELADTFIRLMDITAASGFDIEKAIKDKMAINERRPKRHGKMCSL